MRKADRPQLTVRQRKLIEFLIENPDATLNDAGLAAGYSDKQRRSPTNGAFSALSSPNVQARMRQLMDRDPALIDQALLSRLKDGLNSKKKTYAAHEGEICDEREDDDMPTRKEYLKLALSVKGALVQKQEVSGADGAPLTVKIVKYGDVPADSPADSPDIPPSDG